MFPFLIISAFIAVASGACVPRPRTAASPLYWFAFGDSYTATSFDINGTQPSPEKPMGNPTVGQGTWAGAENYVGWLTTKLNKTLVQTYDMAWPGGTISNEIIPSDLDWTHSFEMQVREDFSPKYASNKFWTSENSMWSVFFGINDIGLRKDDLDIGTFIPRLIDRYFTLCEELYSQSGARRFLFVGVPPLDRSPYVQTWGETRVTAYRDWVNAFNGELSRRIGDFVNRHGDISAATFDTRRWMTDVLDNPAALGFNDNLCVDKSGGPGCIWFDPYHVGSTFHMYMATQMLPALDYIGFAGQQPTPGNKFFW